MPSPVRTWREAEDKATGQLSLLLDEDDARPDVRLGWLALLMVDLYKQPLRAPTTRRVLDRLQEQADAERRNLRRR